MSIESEINRINSNIATAYSVLATKGATMPDTLNSANLASTIMTIEEGGSALSFYPIGAIYLSVNNTNPADLFGGTWEQIKDTFLLAAGDTYSAGSTGGEATHTLTVDEMPSHNHGFKTIEKKAASGTNYSRFASDGDAVGSVITETGGGQAHNNMPPYLAVFMWQRVS